MRISPLDSYGIIRIAGAFALLGNLVGWAFAQQPTPADPGADPFVTIPLYSDPRERIVAPDLGSQPRIRFLTTIDFPPFNFIDQTGKLAGFHVDLVRAICALLDIVDRCQIQAVPWEELQAQLSIGQAEAIAAGLAMTPAHRSQYLFSRSYLKFPARFVGLGAEDRSLQPAKAYDGRRVGVLAGSAHEKLLRNWFPMLRTVTFSQRDLLFTALKAGSIDAVFGDGLRLSYWLSTQQAGNCCAFKGGPVLSEWYFGEGLAIAVRRNAPDLVTAIDHALVQLQHNGQFGEIYLRYFPNGLY